MKYFRTFTAYTIILFLFSNIAIAQNDKSLMKIEVKDGNVFIGYIIIEDSTKIVLETESLGEITIQKSSVVNMEVVDSSKMIEGELWDDNPQATRYLWTPNGYGLHKGEGYYQNIWVFYNQISYGITENISASIGTIPLFLLGGKFIPVWFIPKFSIPIKKNYLNLGIGVFAGTILGESDANFGIAFGSFTIGNRDQNLSLSLGWGYSSDDWAESPLLNISAMVRLSKNSYFLTENYYMPINNEEDMTIISLGIRYMVKKVGLDFGLYMPLSFDMEDFIAIPMLGVTIPLRKNEK